MTALFNIFRLEEYRVSATKALSLGGVKPEPRPPDNEISLTGSDHLAGLARWAAAGRVDEAARARARQHWLARMAEEEATLVGVLLDLAERARPILVGTVAGHKSRGLISVVGADFCILTEPGLGDVIVPLSKISMIRPAPGDQPGTGNREMTLELVFGGVLVELSAERPLVQIRAGDERLRGELRSAGVDVVSLVLDGPGRQTVHVASDAIDHLVILQR